MLILLQKFLISTKLYIKQQKKSTSDYIKSHKEWLDSLTPVQIAQENRRRKGSRKKKPVRLIKDPFILKRPRTPYINYVVEHIKVGDEKGQKGPSRMKEIASQWKTLSVEEKKVIKKSLHSPTIFFCYWILLNYNYYYFF